MHVTPRKTKTYIKTALKDSVLRRAVLNATGSTVASRQAIIDELPYWEDLREKAHAIKKDVIKHLDTTLQTFEQRCTDNGIQVHWAADDQEARQIILGIAERNRVCKVVKSKSLTTEEIHLNSSLIDKGIDTLETDLGEYIIQLMEQIPSHLIIPALHLTRKEIGKLFQEKLGNAYTEDPHELLKIARRTLRQHFLSADMGISGANFGIAETGSICIVENEANAHLTTTLPDIHVAVMGIEKLLPDFKALPYFLKLLPANATGQKSSTFVNFISGPTHAKLGEGPKEMHVVLLDNGRSRILQDPKLRQTLFCIRCASCLNSCPVYQQIGGHAYGWVYMGPIGITLIPQYLGESVGKTSPYVCSLCTACRDACPVKIDLPAHILNLRSRLAAHGKTSRIERTGMRIWAFLARHPRLYRFATWFPGKAQQLLPGGRSFPAPGYTRKRTLPRFDAQGFRKRFNTLQMPSAGQQTEHANSEDNR
ncbi:MAG: LutB/LldF family L-lactate oxidation iron-sulfur protein [candidate division KSB1 bacterium]|nr:LutB/LldF family L-lactate oxidation iron-sulfur protein [candidate division KSB1 bacterium]